MFMQTGILKFSIFLGGILVSIGCTYNKSIKNPEGWTGEYNYQEKPIKAIAGYYMVMDWTLSINRNGESIQGVLEINGQQTYIKLLTDITGNTNEIAIIHNSLIDGSDENLQKGDTLFLLSRNADKLRTTWLKLEPRLLENTDKECYCFIQTNGSH